MSDRTSADIGGQEKTTPATVFGSFSSWTHRVVGMTLVIAGVLVAVVGLGLLLGVVGLDIGRSVGTTLAVVAGGTFALVTVFVPRWIAAD